MTFVRPLGTILPVAVATMSMGLKQAQVRARQNKTISENAMARPAGDGGLSTISSAAGRNAISSRSRRVTSREGNGTIFLAVLSADFMDTSLYAVKRCVAAAGLDQLVVAAVLDETSTLDGHDAIGPAHGRKAVRDDEDGAALGDLIHVVLDDALALI